MLCRTALALLLLLYEPIAGLAAEQRPNVIMIVVDDLRFDEFAAGGHPFLETPNIDRLAAEGAMFTRAYHVTPLCSPNRASLLTGQYVSRHGIIDNTSRSLASHRLDLFPRNLQAAGYLTGHVGKWHMGNDPSPRPGYDYWVSFSGQGKLADPELYEDGGLRQVKGYITDIFTDRALQFMNRARAEERPFFLYIGHKAVHPESRQLDDGSIDLQLVRAYTPAPRHAGRYDEAVLDRAPSYGFTEDDAPGQPVLASALAFKRSPEIQEAYANVIDNGISDNTIRRRAEMVLAIDDGLGRLIDSLAENGELDNTLMVFTSDNGFFYGEHDLSVERRLPYEEAVKAPLLVRYPEKVAAGLVIDGLATSIDIAPTILEVAGVPVPGHVQGTSLVPLLTGRKKSVQDAILMEYYSHENPFAWTVNTDYRAVRKGDYKYIRWLRFDNAGELYDLKVDPYEQTNLASDPSYAKLVSELRDDMNRLVLRSMGLTD